MDSLTQIVLGAACGEAAMGKKIGNKALLFGAIGGTIPDLDVFIGPLFYTNEIDAMAFHRGFMHSIPFAILASLILGWGIHKLYDSGKRKGTTTRKDWTWLFFLSIFTHPILDSFTGYGTQLFLPFSNYRVAFSNISVVDPVYTIPFLLCLIILMFFNRKNQKRKLWLKIGLAISSVYMLFTIGNKLYINSVFKKSLQEQGISYIRYSTQPSILNNILWYGIAETDDGYMVAYYSLFDSTNRFSDWKMLPKSHDVIPKSDKDLATLAWFSNDYYNVKDLGEGKYRYSDLRYPLADPDDVNSSVFGFTLFRDENNRLDMLPFEPGAAREEDGIKKAFADLWKRMKGK